ncbi:MAG TPA: hypothetical protein VHR45_24855 [Thermoanaerobaculia bacterium]|nr:hypothetical protein [Thermoanaerobaculia bacterium]
MPAGRSVRRRPTKKTRSGPLIATICRLTLLAAAIAAFACGGDRPSPPAAAQGGAPAAATSAREQVSPDTQRGAPAAGNGAPAATSAAPAGDNAAPATAAASSSPAAAASSAPDTSAAGSAAQQAPVPLISSRGEPVAAAAAAPAGGIDVDLPPGWVRETPGSSMRLIQASIPGPGGPGQFAVFYFGPGGGGSVDANIERWVGQVESSGPAPRPATFSAHGLRITWVEVAGNLKASTIGMGPSAAQPGSRLLGAVVEGPGGPWFFKATGPDATLAPARAGFLRMLQGARPKS